MKSDDQAHPSRFAQPMARALIRESWKKSKTRDRHRAHFLVKIESAALHQFLYVSVVWIFFQKALSDGPINGPIFSG